jgi:hypothetical protein
MVLMARREPLSVKKHKAIAGTLGAARFPVATRPVQVYPV